METTSCEQEKRNAIVTKQMSSMLDKLSGFQEENDKLKTENARLKDEMQTLQSGFDKVDRELKKKIEYAANLEIQLMDTKASRDELYVESRKVINNVRLWMQEHEKAKQQLRHELAANSEAFATLQQQNE